MTAHSLRHHAAIQRSINPEPTAADSIVRVVRVVGGMSKVETLRLVGHLLNHEKFGDCTNAYYTRIEDALSDLLEEALDAVEPQPNVRDDQADQRWYRQVAA